MVSGEYSRSAWTATKAMAPCSTMYHDLEFSEGILAIAPDAPASRLNLLARPQVIAANAAASSVQAPGSGTGVPTAAAISGVMNAPRPPGPIEPIMVAAPVFRLMV